MIIGKGDIAQSLTGLDRLELTFFASGVSNSSEVRKSEFDREIALLNRIATNENLVYFSSLSVYYSTTPYALHKYSMELLVRNWFPNHTIVRLGNISWGSNKNTIINYFKLCYSKGIQPELQDVYRHVVNRREFEYWISKIRPGEPDIMNIPGEFIHVKELWRRVINGEY